VNKIRLEVLGLSASQSQSGSFAMILGEQGKNRRLPIIIGMFEAQAIALVLEKIQASRPMTHDLFKHFASAFNFRVQEILISDLREGVFYSRIVCLSENSERIEIDARPSDAIAIGLRFNAPIFTYASILSEAGIVVNENEEENQENDPTAEAPETETPTTKTPITEFTVEQLNELLNEALDEEDYEKAARIRDEIQKRGA